LAFYRWHDKGQISRGRWRQVLDAVQVRVDFVSANPALVAHLSPARQRELTWEVMLREAYRAFYQGDFHTAQRLFRTAFLRRIWRARDLKFICAAWLPAAMFAQLATRVSGVAQRR
jgi:hypothetical protein